MADDRMKNDDLQRNMGAGAKDQGQQSPGRGGQGGQQGQQGQQAGQHGQHGGGQQSGGQQSGGQYGGQKGTRNMEDDEDDFGAGKSGQSGSQNRGGQNR